MPRDAAETPVPSLFQPDHDFTAKRTPASPARPVNTPARTSLRPGAAPDFGVIAAPDYTTPPRAYDVEPHPELAPPPEVVAEDPDAPARPSEPRPGGRVARSAPRGRTGEQELAPGLTASRLRRLARLDHLVFHEVAGDPTQTLTAMLVAAGAIVLAAVGGWLWLILSGDGLSSSAIALRAFFLGSLFAFALWHVWVLTTRLLLGRVFGRHVERGPLYRAMAFATVPLVGQLAMLVTPLAFGIGVITLVGWFAMSMAAIEAAVPQATRKEVVTANAIGFGVMALALSALADAAAIAPGAFALGSDLSRLV